MKTLLLASCIIAFAAALPAEDVVVPEQALFEAVDADFEATRTEFQQLRAKGTSDKDCRKLADATENDVKASVKAQQDALNSIDKGGKCPTKHAQEVKGALKILDKANADKKKADDAYAKAKKTKINFGDFTYDQLTPGQCALFFNKAVYKKADTAVKQAEIKAATAKGFATASQKAYDSAVEDQKKAIKKCHCDVKKLQKATLGKMNSDVKAANKKLYKKAADLRCLLDGTPASKCKVGSIPVVVPVKVTAATAAVNCGPPGPTGLVTFTKFTGSARGCGSAPGGAGCVVKWRHGHIGGWVNDAVGNQQLKPKAYRLQDKKKFLGYGFCATKGTFYSKSWERAMIGLDHADSDKSYADIDIAMSAEKGSFMVYMKGKLQKLSTWYKKKGTWKLGGQACMWIAASDNKDYGAQARFWLYDSRGWRMEGFTNAANPHTKSGKRNYPQGNPQYIPSHVNYHVDAAMYSGYSQFADIYWINQEPKKGSKAKPPMA